MITQPCMCPIGFIPHIIGTVTNNRGNFLLVEDSNLLVLVVYVGGSYWTVNPVHGSIHPNSSIFFNPRLTLGMPGPPRGAPSLSLWEVTYYLWVYLLIITWVQFPVYAHIFKIIGSL